MSYQKLIAVGHLGEQPDLRYTPGGTAVANFSMATNRNYTNNKGQKVEETMWLRVSVWGSQAEAISKYLEKGSRVLIDGRLRPDPETGGPRIWTRQDGTPGASFEVTARRVVFLTSKSEGGSYNKPTGEDFGIDDDEGEIPF